MKMKHSKKFLLAAFLLFYFAGVFYLLLPPPSIPDLPGSLKSTEPGDTVQIPGVWAYYTNLSRREAINFFKNSFHRSSFLNIPLPTYILNHPPEYARQTIRDTQQSNFYEEIVHPLRESLFVNGWIPSEDKVYLAKSQKPITTFIIDGQVFSAKITLYYVSSSVWARLLVWTGIMVAIVLIGYYFALIIGSPWKRK